MVSELGSETRSYDSVIFVYVSAPKVFQCLCSSCSSYLCLCDLVKKKRKKNRKEKEIQSVEKKTKDREKKKEERLRY